MVNMRNLWIGVLITISLTGFGQKPQVSTGSLGRITAFPSNYIAARNVDVWLPPHYNPKKQYPVLYMHDGQMLFDAATTWNKQEWGIDETAGRMILADSLPPFIVVGIWNNGKERHAEYFPQKAITMIDPNKTAPLMGLLNNQPLADLYLKFIVKELKPYIDSHYGTKPDQKDTYMAGSSMGGLISLYAICEYPSIFGSVACISTHWTGIFTNKDNPIPDAIFDYLSNYLPDPKTHRIYFDHGDKTLDSLYAPYQAKADIILQKAGYSQKNWQTKVFKGADHSEIAWSNRLSIPLYFMMGNR
jgi:predicted alpha/beta superfamily hydrolase